MRLRSGWESACGRCGDYRVAASLQSRSAKAKPGDRVLKCVPSMKVLKADLAFAGINYGNAKDGYADLHAQRKSLNTLLASHKVDSRTRQSQLRHTDPRLTEDRYFDHQMFLAPQAEQISRVPAIPKLSQADGPADAAITSSKRAQLAHKTRGSEGHLDRFLSRRRSRSVT